VEQILNQVKMSASKKRKIDENHYDHRTFLSVKEKYELLLKKINLKEFFIFFSFLINEQSSQ
jgi:hypothetical protein